MSLAKRLQIAFLLTFLPIVLLLVAGIIVTPPLSGLPESVQQTTKCEWLYDNAYAAATSAQRLVETRARAHDNYGRYANPDAEMSQTWSALYLACRNRLDPRYPQ